MAHLKIQKNVMRAQHIPVFLLRCVFCSKTRNLIWVYVCHCRS